MSNSGVESIRLGGMSIDQLPIAEAAITKQQLPEIIVANKKQEVENIRAEYPRGRVTYYEARIVECEDNIKRVRQLIIDQNKMINDYTSHVSLCNFRDKQLEGLDPDRNDKQIKKLKADFPTYNVDAMKQQIEQCRQAIDRSNEVIDKEHKSIAELRDVINKCKVRDEKLKPYGVDIE